MKYLIIILLFIFYSNLVKPSECESILECAKKCKQKGSEFKFVKDSYKCVGSNRSPSSEPTELIERPSANLKEGSNTKESLIDDNTQSVDLIDSSDEDYIDNFLKN